MTGYLCKEVKGMADIQLFGFLTVVYQIAPVWDSPVFLPTW